MASFTLARLVTTNASAMPDAPAITMGPASFSWRDLDQRSTALATALIDSGVAAGDRVAVLNRNAPSFFEMMFACGKAGLILVALNWRLASSELAGIAADAEPRLVFYGREFAHLLPDSIPAAHLVDIDADYESLVAAGDRETALPDADPDDVVLQLYSSGTTGRPKGVMLTNANLGMTAKMGAGAWAMTAESVNLLHSPLFHVGGAVYAMTGMGQGAHTVLIPEAKVGTILEAVAQHGITHSWFVPTLIRDLLDACDAGQGDLSGLQIMGYGGAPIEVALVRRALGSWNCGFLGVYGTTETASTLTALLPGDHEPDSPREFLLSSVGQPLPWIELEVVNPQTRQPIDRGEVGEIMVRSAQTMKGYWNQPELTAEVLSADGWFRTGDAGYQDPEGYVFLKDRLKDVIISGGENIYPAEVEAVLHAHDLIAEAAVVSAPHERWGETVRAVIVLKPDATLNEDQLLAYCRDRLAHYKCPTVIDFVDGLPHNAAGKVLRRELRDVARHVAAPR
jgi:long-chain acyl-CoA synthetase